MNRESNQFACAHPNRVKSKLTGIKLKSMSNSKYSMILVVIKTIFTKKIFTFFISDFQPEGLEVCGSTVCKIVLVHFLLGFRCPLIHLGQFCLHGIRSIQFLKL